MKKIIYIIVITLLLSSCKGKSNPLIENNITTYNSDINYYNEKTDYIDSDINYNIEKNDETVSVDSELNYNSEKSDNNDHIISDNPYNDEKYDSILIELMNAFKEKDKTKLCFLGCAQSEEVFDFIDNIVISDYSIISSEIIEGSNLSDFEKKYIINVTVDYSSDERFFVGKNTWEITALNTLSDYSFFGTLYINNMYDKKNIRKLMRENNISEEVRFCYRLMVELEPYIRYTDGSNLQIPDDNKEEFYSSLSRFLGSFASEQSTDKYNIVSYKMFGIEPNFSDENIEPLWLGAYEKDAVIVSEKDNEIIIDFYADSLLLTKAYTIKFNLDTTDGIRLISYEIIYESELISSFYTT